MDANQGSDQSADRYQLHRAVKEKQSLLVSKLIEQDPSQLSIKDEDGRTPLFWALSMGGPEVCSVILSFITQNIKSNNKLRDFDVDETDESGWTALHIASSVGALQTVEELVGGLDADVNAQTNSGQTPLHFAVSKNHKSVVEYLLKNGASARIRDKMNQNPMFRAASAGNATLVQMLISPPANCPLNTSDINGWTCLHHAYAEGHGDIVLLLIKAGADPTKENSEGSTPEQVAVDDKVKDYVNKHLS